MSKLDNKGYMLVEIILAFALAFGLAYFLLELTIKLKNKNDDLLVKTLVSTDQAIIYNTIMESIYNENFSCSKLNVNGDTNTFSYDGFTSIVTEYAAIGNVICSDNPLLVSIPITVKQLPDSDFNIKIDS